MNFSRPAYLNALKHISGIGWHEVPQEFLFASTCPGVPAIAVTPDNVQFDADWRYFQPKNFSTEMMSPERFVKNMLRANYDTPLFQPSYAYQFGHEFEFVSMKLPPKLFGNWLIESELSLCGEFKLAHEMNLSLDPFQTAFLDLSQHEADEAMKGLIGSIDINDFDVHHGVCLSLCCDAHFMSTRFSVFPGEPIRFEAAFESKEAKIGYWEDFKVAANLDMVLKGSAAQLSSRDLNRGYFDQFIHEFKESAELIAIAVFAVAVGVAIFTLFPAAIIGMGLIGGFAENALANNSRR